MTRIYKGGCNIPFPLIAHGYIIEPQALQRCASGALGQHTANSGEDLKGVCRTCEHATITAHLEEAIEKPVTGAAADLPRSTPIAPPFEQPVATPQITVVGTSGQQLAPGLPPGVVPPTAPGVQTVAPMPPPLQGSPPPNGGSILAWLDNQIGAAPEPPPAAAPAAPVAPSTPVFRPPWEMATPTVAPPPAEVAAPPAEVAPPPGPPPGISRRPLPPDQPVPIDLGTTMPWGTKDDRPPLRELLPQLGGPSVNGDSKQRDFKVCLRRGFYSYILGLRKRWSPELEVPHPSGDPGRAKIHLGALELGGLFHELMARAVSGAGNPLGILDTVRPVYPHLAIEAQRLYQNVVHTAGEAIAAWDVRFVELETRYYFPKRQVKTARRKVSLCVSARHDVGIYEPPPGQGKLPPGEVAPRIRVEDWKTTSAVTEELRQSFNHNAKALSNLLCFNRGYAVDDDGKLSAKPARELYGPCYEFSIVHVGKAKDWNPDLHLRRVPYAINDAELDAYAAATGDWLYGVIADRLYHKDVMKEATWPKSYLCDDPVTGRRCPFVWICDKGGLAGCDPSERYDTIPESFRLSAAAIEYPAPAKKGPRRKKAAAAAEVESK